MFLIKIITTMHPFKMILIFIDTLHVTLFQKKIFIFSNVMVLLIFYLFLNCIQNKQFFIEISMNCFKFKKIHIKRTKLLFIKIIITTHPFKMILIFIDMLHVTLFQKNIFIFSNVLVLLIFNLFLNFIQIERFFIKFQ